MLLGTVDIMGVLARQFDRRFYALCSGIAEEDPVEVRGAAEHPCYLGLKGDLIEVGAVNQFGGLLLYGPDERRVPVPEGVRGDPAYKVQVPVPFFVEEPATFPSRRRYPQTFVGLHHCLHAATPSDMRVPTRSPATAAASAPFLLPLSILASTPPRAASAAARSLGTIPPAASPLSTYPSHSSGASASTALPSMSSPSTSVRKNRCAAPRPTASAAAAESALTLYAPSGPSPTGATTGTKPPDHSVSTRWLSTRVTFPTRPRPGMGSTRSVGPSVPETPTAGIPSA